jgi:diadenosine tetraphosphate (Ap4A) HIT family hydrolase
MPGPASRGGCHTAEMADEDACFSCSNNERTDLPPRERIYIGPRWRVAHAFGTALPGWLVLLPRRHVTALDELTAAEAEELGPLLRAVTRTLREVTGCDKTYVALFAEAEGFAHAHFHVIPRHPDLDPELRGPRVFNLLGADSDRSVPDAAMDEIALRIASALTMRRETAGDPGA